MGAWHTTHALYGVTNSSPRASWCWFWRNVWAFRFQVSSRKMKFLSFQNFGTSSWPSMFLWYGSFITVLLMKTLTAVHNVICCMLCLSESLQVMKHVHTHSECEMDTSWQVFWPTASWPASYKILRLRELREALLNNDCWISALA